MQTNPIMERIVRLSEQFKTTLQEQPQVRIVSWLGASASEYKMIKGFVMFHMSEESTLDDIFISCHQPFQAGSEETYGRETCKLMDQYVEAWNKNERLTSQTGIIGWKSQYNGKQTDAENFVKNMHQLATDFSCDKEQKLIVVLMPQRIDDLKSFKAWIKEILEQPIDDSLCFMLYDTYDERLFNSFDEKYQDRFLYIQPDMDLYGAVNQILENSKQANKDQQEQDVISFQQILIKLSLAVSRQNEKQASDHARQAIALVKPYDFYHLEAVIYYFLYNLYVSVKKEEKAEKAIDKALLSAQKAVDLNIEGSKTSYCQYLVVKGNTFLFRKKYSRAILFYSEALQISNAENMLNYRINMCQMLGLCYRKSGDSDQAWQYLTEGWQLIETMKVEEIQQQPVLCYYAFEMTKLSRGEESERYESRFREIWGEGWSDTIKQQYKTRKKSFNALSVKN